MDRSSVSTEKVMSRCMCYKLHYKLSQGCCYLGTGTSHTVHLSVFVSGCLWHSVCMCVSGCVWLSLTASKGAGFILTLIMRERPAMPSSHFSSSSILPVASGCFSFSFLAPFFTFFPVWIICVSFPCPSFLCLFLSSLFPLRMSVFMRRWHQFKMTGPCLSLSLFLCHRFKCWLTIFHQPRSIVDYLCGPRRWQLCFSPQ